MKLFPVLIAADPKPQATPAPPTGPRSPGYSPDLGPWPGSACQHCRRDSATPSCSLRPGQVITLQTCQQCEDWT